MNTAKSFVGGFVLGLAIGVVTLAGAWDKDYQDDWRIGRNRGRQQQQQDLLRNQLDDCNRWLRDSNRWEYSR
jgi:hypothetical protein